MSGPISNLVTNVIEKVIKEGVRNNSTILADFSKEPTSPLANRLCYNQQSVILTSLTTASSANLSSSVFICSKIIYICSSTDTMSFSSFTTGVGRSLPA